MNQLRFRKSLLSVAVLCLLTSLAPAAEILSLLPGDALSFAFVRDAQSTNDKIIQLINIYEEGVPAPLDMVQAMTGLSEGLELNGDVLFALLPAGESEIPAPMFLLPVKDYAAFANTIQADASGAVCRVKIADEDVYVAQHGEYALVMNLEHQEIMHRVLAGPTRPPADLAKQQAWLDKNDVSVIITSAGITHLARIAEQKLVPIDTLTPEAENQAAAREIAHEMMSIGDADLIADLFKDDVESAGVGLAIDDSINSRLRWSVVLKPEHTEVLPEMSDKPLVGYPNEPYALAGGGPVPAEFIANFPEWSTQLSREMAEVDGRGDFTDEDWKEVEESYRLASAGIKGVSVLLTPVAPREPLLSIVYARLEVASSKEYLNSMKKTIELTNKLARKSKSDIKLIYEIKPAAIAGTEGFEITCDFDKAAGDGDNHIWQTLLTSLLDIDHILSVHYAAIDDTHVAIGLESPERMGRFIENYRAGTTGLADSEPPQQTLKLLEQETPWLLLINPEGYVELVKSAMKSMMVLGFMPEIPAYPASPPIAASLAADGTRLHGEIVLPADAARAMSKFIEEVEKSPEEAAAP
jgi:hypothetical protein